VQTWYFLFQVIQVFLVTALSSSATAFIPEIIANPNQVPLILAKNLPKSANFYLTYFILQGLASSTKNMLNYKDFVFYYLEKLFYNTPRANYYRYTSLKGISWGKLYPKFTNFIIIGLAYSCISPLVLGVASIGLSLFYVSYRYNLLFVMQPQLETNGRCYTRALSQIFIGLYIGELALIGLMGLQKATGPSILVSILFFGTVVYNNILNRFLNPLEDRLPEKLLSEDYDEEDPLLSAEEGEARLQEAHERSRLHNFGQDIHIPHRILDPIARFFEPHIYASHGVMKRYLRGADPEPPSYSKEELETAYANPLLTSKIGKVWLPHDQAGLSKQEVEANIKAGIETTDEGAWFDKRGHVKIDEENLRNTPIWKAGVQY
jgi:calcium permeable stress-gated cation channel